MTQVIVCANHPYLLEWCAQRLPAIEGFPEHSAASLGWAPDNATCIAQLDSATHTPSYVVVFSGRTAHHIEATVASDSSKRPTRPFIEAIYRYAFDVCLVQRINMFTSVFNASAVNTHQGLGHVQEGRARDWFGPGHDAFLYGFTRNDWRTSKWNRRHREDS